ncbi:ATP-binding protein [Micromonospora aurantiaca (nom. illeg.)]|uniref:ATP-binding protein n=1 Tax=Micromonospora aurantiaca (nom. illeg.) TaxID=47850 RepID=UPI003F4A1BBC
MGEDDRAGGQVPARPVMLLSRHFTAETVTALRHLLAVKVAAAGLSGGDGDDFVLAVHELVTNAVRHGGGSGHLELRHVDDVLVCEVMDHGAGSEPLPVELPPVHAPGGRGLWLAHQLTCGLTLTHRPDGVTATARARMSRQTTAAVAQQSAAAGADAMVPASGMEGEQE